MPMPGLCHDLRQQRHEVSPLCLRLCSLSRGRRRDSVQRCRREGSKGTAINAVSLLQRPNRANKPKRHSSLNTAVHHRCLLLYSLSVPLRRDTTFPFAVHSLSPGVFVVSGQKEGQQGGNVQGLKGGVQIICNIFVQLFCYVENCL